MHRELYLLWVPFCGNVASRTPTTTFALLCGFSLCPPCALWLSRAQSFAEPPVYLADAALQASHPFPDLSYPRLVLWIGVAPEFQELLVPA